jgi:hypothetical protein
MGDGRLSEPGCCTRRRCARPAQVSSATHQLHRNQQPHLRAIKPRTRSQQRFSRRQRHDGTFHARLAANKLPRHATNLEFSACKMRQAATIVAEELARHIQLRREAIECRCTAPTGKCKHMLLVRSARKAPSQHLAATSHQEGSSAPWPCGMVQQARRIPWSAIHAAKLDRNKPRRANMQRAPAAHGAIAPCARRLPTAVCQQNGGYVQGQQPMRQPAAGHRTRASMQHAHACVHISCALGACACHALSIRPGSAPACAALPPAGHGRILCGATASIVHGATPYSALWAH